MKIGNKAIIKDITKIISKMSYNDDMIKFIGNKVKIINIIDNCYDGKRYYKLNIDLGKYTWCEEWLTQTK